MRVTLSNSHSHDLLPDLPATGYLEFWHAILIELGTLLVVVVNGMTILRVQDFLRYDATDVAAALGSREKAVVSDTPQAQGNIGRRVFVDVEAHSAVSATCDSKKAAYVFGVSRLF
jgi:hypothetical protein